MGVYVSKGERSISMAVVRRLPKYHRYLKDLLDRGVNRISSKELSEIIGFTASQIRQDLNNFGGFGQQGYGYNVEDLYEEIGNILGINNKYNVIIVGAGNMGQAIANYPWFENRGLKIIGLFDRKRDLIGKRIKDIKVYDERDLREFVIKNDVRIIIIATPKDEAQGIINELEGTNIEGVWNFAPIDLEVPEGISVENAHLSDSLFVLSYMINERNLF